MWSRGSLVSALLLLVDMDGNSRDCWDGDGSLAIAIDSDGWARRQVIGADDVAVGAGWKTSGQSDRPRGGSAVHSDESLAATRESNLVAVSLLPVSNIRGASSVSPGNHVGDWSPTMFADPILSVVAVGAIVDVN